MPKKHILIVSQYFYPEEFRINDMALEWVKRGYKVTVVTGIPNYPKGEFFEGYDKKNKRYEQWNGIDIIRLSISPRKTGSFNMIKNYLSFVYSGFWWNIRTKIKADYVFCFEVSPMTQALIAVWYAKKRKIPCYLYVQDLWPENVITVTGISNPVIIKPIDIIVDYIYKNTDHIFATSPSFVDAICNRKTSVDRSKVHYWPQYAEEFYQPTDKKSLKEIPNDNSFKIIFTGNIGTAQGLQILPETAELLQTENIKFVMVGDGRYLQRFNIEVKKRNVQNKFIMVDRKPAEMIPSLLAACDVAFISFNNDELWNMTIPAKLQSYMACGMPIVASAGGETKRIIEESNCGICGKIGDAKGLADNIIKLSKIDTVIMKNNSYNYAKRQFNKKKLMDEIDSYFKD